MTGSLGGSAAGHALLERGEDDLGEIYGVQWRNWPSSEEGPMVNDFDQVRNLIDGLKSGTVSVLFTVAGRVPAAHQTLSSPWK